MNAKYSIAIITGLVALLLTGCRTVKSGDAVGIGYEGGKAIGRLEQLHSNLAELSQREAARSELEQQELDRITGTARDLGTTIRELVGFAQRLLDENNRLRAEIEELSKGEPDTGINTGNPHLD